MKDSHRLSENQIDEISTEVVRRLIDLDSVEKNSNGWYPGKYAEEFIKRISESSGDEGRPQMNGKADVDQFQQTAIYKSKLQKGGRIAVPEVEMETIGIEPGDALQVILHPIENKADNE
jgi:hypothetical protein